MPGSARARSVSVLIVDAQSLARIGVRALIEATPDMHVVGEATNGEEAVARADALRPDVIVMDPRIPDGTEGVAAIERILAEKIDPQPNVVILSDCDADRSLQVALRAGVTGFLLKTSDMGFLATAINIVADGGTFFARSITQRLIDNYVAHTDVYAVLPEQIKRLTRREREVLRLAARGLGNTQIAEKLVISQTTVKSHLNRAMSKLSLQTRAQAVAFAYETGLVIQSASRAPGGQGDDAGGPSVTSAVPSS